jgi:LPXTG-motif cell wall-anchored protein
MKAPVITLLTAALLCVVFAVTALASSAPLDYGTIASSVGPLGAGSWMQEPGTAAVGGVTQLPSTSTDSNPLLFAIGAVLTTFGIAMLALRRAVAKR